MQLSYLFLNVTPFKIVGLEYASILINFCKFHFENCYRFRISKRGFISGSRLGEAKDLVWNEEVTKRNPSKPSGHKREAGCVVPGGKKPFSNRLLPSPRAL